MARRKAESREAALALRRFQDFEAVGLSGANAHLVANRPVEVRRTGPKSVEGARRLDAFDALKPEMARKSPGAYDAARRLETDLRIRRGEDDPGRPMERVDGGEGVFGRLDRRLAAGLRVDKVLALVGARDRALLEALIYPTPERDSWRDTVAAVTGEQHPHAQGAAVRAACANLAEAYGRVR
jgi:hypothetical protein